MRLNGRVNELCYCERSTKLWNPWNMWRFLASWRTVGFSEISAHHGVSYLFS
jgi:hypothetical protein